MDSNSYTSLISRSVRHFLGRMLFAVLVTAAAFRAAQAEFPSTTEAQNTPAVLVLYDGPEIDKNPGRIDALYLTNLLGHFTTRRSIISLDQYRPGMLKDYDAVFCIIYNIKYTIPEVFLNELKTEERPFCWLGNQVEQLGKNGLLQRHGLRFVRHLDQSSFTQVLYKGRTLVKGGSETNVLAITDPHKSRALAVATGPDHQEIPYILESGSFWVVADSPFSYSDEGDRMLAFADVLHDILGINHPEDHKALLRIEDINALSDPEELKRTLSVIRKYHIPFSFGFVPMYVNPNERIYLHLGEKPAVVDALKEYADAGGTAVLHGFTHQHRGVTTDDYEFWDDLGDRPIQGDSDNLASRRIEQAIRESLSLGLYPITWETPHYAASSLDYRIFKRHFGTVYERRISANSLDSDELFPYPIIDIYGQYIIPEDLAYVPIEDPTIEPILKNAEAAWVVRDGYASVFFHPFMSPQLLDGLISGIQARGYHFIDLRGFPNTVEAPGDLITTQTKPITIAGHGRYLNEMIYGPHGEVDFKRTLEIPTEGNYSRDVKLKPGETYVVQRQDARPPSWLEKLVRLAKGDLSVLQRRWESVMPWHGWHDPLRTVILWNPNARGKEATDQQSFYNTLDAMGFEIRQANSESFLDEELGSFTLLVIPCATAKSMPPDTVAKILGALKGGITLLTDGDSPLAQALGIRLGDPIPVESLVNSLFINQSYSWADRPSVPYITAPSGHDIMTYYADREGHALAIGGSHGEGKYLYFAPLYDPISGSGYARFPDLPSLLLQEFNLTPLLKRRGADAYFDPGYRQNVSIERLAPFWRRSGIRTIHAAAWHFYDKYTYDYARLIRVAHQNGILVNAWFEWPHVSEFFWNHHPEWREKTGLLTDAHVDWRYLMNLENPQCLKALLDDMKSFLKKYDWDGVNFAELEFETMDGPESPEHFTPFNNHVRKEFQEKHGFDPLELLKEDSPNYWENNPAALRTFYEYRQGLMQKLLESILEAVDDLQNKQKRSWEVVLTTLDTLDNPKLADNLAIDMKKFAQLAKDHGAILQIEDPESEWSKSPDRYEALGKRYKTLLGGAPLMIDVNILPVHPPTQIGFASAQPTGSEILALWKSAASEADRVCLYSESSVHEQDWALLPYAMAANSHVTKEGSSWLVESPNTVIMELGRGTRRYKLDGQSWPCVDKGEVLIPPGRHNLSFSTAQGSWFDMEQLKFHLLTITGELLGCEERGRGLRIEYTSPGRCLMMFNKEPESIMLDGISTRLSVLKGPEGFVLSGPPGQHRIEVSQPALLYTVGIMSLYSASLIVLFGMASSSLLAILFVFIFIHRRTRRIRRFILSFLRSGRKAAVRGSR